jgi:hypothetical protein
MAVALALSALVAVKTGEAQDERVERVVPEQPLESHEDAAETFLALTSGLALLVAAGLVRGRAGGFARVLGTAGAVGLVGVATYVGPTGGKLVYQYGAASAYAAPNDRVSVTAARRNDAAARPEVVAGRRESEDGDDR